LEVLIMSHNGKIRSSTRTRGIFVITWLMIIR
jgi:hypothetical protein